MGGLGSMHTNSLTSRLRWDATFDFGPDCLVATCCEAKYENIPGTRVQAAAGRKQNSCQTKSPKAHGCHTPPRPRPPLGRWPTRPRDHTGGDIGVGISPMAW